MSIQILDSETIDKIAAGEVIERPLSVVKELVENAIDANATAIAVEAKEGGIEFIRVSDNGCGMEENQIRKAFLRHATSKIRTADDLLHLSSLGFRGEALSSIAAVAKVELITKTEDTLIGNRILLEGGVEKNFEEIGAPQGTTFLVRNLFYNTPVRRKFLKTPSTEGGYIADLTEHLALARPDISFKFILGNQTKFYTSGSGNLKDVIYRIYGRNVTKELLPISYSSNGIQIQGYLAKPTVARSNRNQEIYFINGRFIKSNLIARGIEEGYKEYLMQHKFPFCVLHITVDLNCVDVNVHPNKMDVRFSNAGLIQETLTEAVKSTLRRNEMIPAVSIGKEDALGNSVNGQEGTINKKIKLPEPFETKREEVFRVAEETRYQIEQEDFFLEHREIIPLDSDRNDLAPQQNNSENVVKIEEDFFIDERVIEKQVSKKKEAVVLEQPKQMNLFDEKILTVENREKYRVIGQVFDTYWLIEFEDKMLMIDQHAAHEKVKYERLMQQYKNKEIITQSLMPPIIVSLSGQEETVLSECKEAFLDMGFEMEAFGGSEYALRTVPVDLYGCNEKELFLEVLDELMTNRNFKGEVMVIHDKIASMACKAAVKGNNRLSYAEAEQLIDELLTLDNPYNCPHGRPTIISMTKSEMEKKFKRIVS